MFAFQQVSAGSELSEQSPDSGISIQSAGQYHTAVMIRKLHLELLQSNQEKERERKEKEKERERAQKLEQENQEFKRKLAEKERENTEK